jgi:hypothetical protein
VQSLQKLCGNRYIVACSFKTRLVESQNPAVIRQWPANNRGVVFSAQSVPRSSKRNQLAVSPVWARDGTLHRDPASRRRRRRGKSRIWESKIWSWVPRDSDPWMNALASASSNRKWQTRPLVRERVLHQQTSNCQTGIKFRSYPPDECFIAKHIDRLTVGRNMRLKTQLLFSSCDLMLLEGGRWERGHLGNTEEEGR